MYNEVEVKAILIAVHNIENVGLNSKKVLLNSIEWLRCQYEITQDESFLIKAVWHIYAYLELGYPYISGELEFNRILNCLQLDINTVFPKKGWAYKKVALKKSNINQILGRWHPHFQSMKIEAAILDIIDKVENKKIGSFIYHCGKMLEQKDNKALWEKTFVLRVTEDEAVLQDVNKSKCLMNKQYARMHACEIGDMIQIRDKRLKVIGLIDNSVYSGMIIPYQTMLNVYKEEKDIQFSGTFFCENELQKQKRIDEVIEQIKEKDNHADILGVTEGEELYKNALYTKIQWRIVRGMCALVAILFFMINETIVLMAKAKKERKIMGINLALGATERDIKYCLFFETLLVTLLAVFLVMITLRPLAKLASLEHIIILDSMVIVETVILAVWACEILTWIIVSRIKKENIADMVRTTRDI